MYELSIAGEQTDQRIKRTLREGDSFRLGRAPKEGWAVPWDRTISREHADISFSGGKLTIRCLDSAQNAILYRGQLVREATLGSGETVRIGNTDFSVDELNIGDAGMSPHFEQAFTVEETSRFGFGNAEAQLEVLARFPEVVAQADGTEQLAESLPQLVVDAIPNAQMAAVLRFPHFDTPEELEPESVFWTSRGQGEGCQTSRRLLHAALSRQQSVLHMWSGDESDDVYTRVGGADWAFCVPVRSKAGAGWCIYVTGPGFGITGPDDLKGDLRFTEVVAQFLGSINDVQVLEREQASLSQFFSPKVIRTLKTDAGGTVLTPREGQITVLFCDVRGFSRKAEQFRDDLVGLLGRVSEALGVMTRGIIGHDGVIADFQGDAALGFWGWPGEQTEAPLLAARAAMQIFEEFRQARADSTSNLADFRVGIGVAAGRAVAGRMGTDQQIKVGAFGPVVNVGSRLEGMTKQFGTPVLLNGATGEYVREHIRPEEGRCRRIGRICPKGMQDDLDVYELLPPVERSHLSDAYIGEFEQVVADIGAGRWSEAAEWLSSNAEHDGAAQFMLNYITRRELTPPADFNGVIVMEEK